MRGGHLIDMRELRQREIEDIARRMRAKEALENERFRRYEEISIEINEATALEGSRRNGAQQERIDLLQGKPLKIITQSEYHRMLKGQFDPWGGPDGQ